MSKSLKSSLIVGLTGPSGSGKSEAVNLLSQIFSSEERKVFFLDADEISHGLLKNNFDLVKKLVESFSAQIFGDNALKKKHQKNIEAWDVKLEIDRKKLGELVFSDKQKLNKLNELVFPFVKAEILKIIELNRKHFDIIFLDAPTLIESTLCEVCDKVIVVIAKRDLRLKRVILRDGISLSQAENRFNSQLSDEEYIEKSDFVLFNDKDLQHLKKQLTNVVRML